MKCSACGSAAVSTGLGNHVSCFDCGYHGENFHAGEPSLHGDSNVTVEPEPAPKKKAK